MDKLILTFWGGREEIAAVFLKMKSRSPKSYQIFGKLQ